MGTGPGAQKVTFLFTDIEGSTRLLRGLGELAYADVLADHRRALREALTRHGGVEVDTQGDAFFFAFPTPEGALEGAHDGSEALGSGPVRVRIGVHTGTAVRTSEGYVGEDVHRAARIAASGSGGQILVSRTTVERVDGARFTLVDLGDHRFKDLDEPERVYQLGEGTFPPIRSLYRATLPIPTTPFLGREAEVAEVASLLGDDEVSLVTLTGPGGTGKTRLALRAADEMTRSFPDGVWWVPFASVTDPAPVAGRMVEALGLADDGDVSAVELLATRLGGRRDLLVLDNAEQLLPDLAEVVASILGAVEGPTFLVTSREPLRIGAEREVRVPSMARADAIELALARAAAVGVTLSPGDADALAQRLEDLPLAIFLAVPRLTLFSVPELIEQLGSRLDLLRGGPDIDPRHATLRATIDWSYELLDDEERASLERMSVFVGGCTVGTAIEVARADPVVLEALLSKSLLQRRDAGVPRLWMQVAVLSVAAERLVARGEAEAMHAAHAAWCCALAERVDSELRAGEPEEVAIAALDAEIDNIRAAVDHALATDDTDLVRRITVALPMYWQMHDRYAEARAWLDRALAISPEEDELRVRLLLALATIAYRQGDHGTSTSAADDAADLVMRLGGVRDRFQDLKLRASQAWDRGETEDAERLFADAMGIAVAADNGVGISSCRLNLGSIANLTGRHVRADDLFHQNLPFVRGRGQSRCEAFTLIGLAETAALMDRPREALSWALAAGERAGTFSEESLVAYSVDVAARALAQLGRPVPATTLLAASAATRRRLGIEPDAEEAAVREAARAAIGSALDADDAMRAETEGAALDLIEVLWLARDAASDAAPVAG